MPARLTGGTRVRPGSSGRLHGPCLLAGSRVHELLRPPGKAQLMPRTVKFRVTCGLSTDFLEGGPCWLDIFQVSLNNTWCCAFAPATSRLVELMIGSLPLDNHAFIPWLQELQRCDCTRRGHCPTRYLCPLSDVLESTTPRTILFVLE